MKITQIKTDDLKPYKLNAKRHPQTQIEGIAESIKRFGFTQPIVIDGSNEIIIGHGRLEAAKLAGLKDVPCIKLSDLSKDEVKALRLIDNRISETGWDNELLALEFNELDFDFSKFNIDFNFLQTIEGVQTGSAKEEWDGMPDYEEKEPCFRKIVVSFETQQDVDDFSKLMGQEISEKCKSVWHPKKDRRDLKDINYE